MRFFNFMNGYGLASFTAILLAMLAFGPVSAYGASMSIRECPPKVEGEELTCKESAEPKEFAECEAAVTNMKQSNSAEQLAIDMINRKGWTYQIVCQSTPYSFVVPSE